VRLYFLAQLLFDTNTRLAYHLLIRLCHSQAKEALGAFEL
jgi:hypothetical protein